MSRAVVVGAGFAGLFAAAALRDRFDELIVLERDPLAADSSPRRGVPQGRQLHNLLGRAQLHAEQLLPGYIERLKVVGCGVGCVSSDTYVHELGVRMPERDLGFELLSATRPVADHTARSMLSSDVEFVDHSPVVGLTTSGRNVITGVQISTSNGTQTLSADLIVDASGPASISARWMGERGIEVPVDEHHADQWYVCAEVRLPASVEHHPFLMVFPTNPKTRGGLMSPVGDGTFYVSLSGKSADVVPRTFDEMQLYARTLEDSCIADRLEGAVALGVPRVFHRQVAVWRRFDKVPMPGGLVVVGDAVAALNPLFGQGMSGAAWEVSHLATLDLDEALPDRFAALTAGIVQMAWSLGEVVTNSLVVRRGEQIVDLTPALASCIADDPALHEQYVRIWHMLEPADALRHSDVATRLLDRALELRGAQ